jgi:hypothetical protein
LKVVREEDMKGRTRASSRASKSSARSTKGSESSGLARSSTEPVGK